MRAGWSPAGDALGGGQAFRARRPGASGFRPFQGAVHGQRGVLREGRATEGSDDVVGARRRSGPNLRDRSSGGARAARGAALRKGEEAAEDDFGHGDIALVVSLHSGTRAAELPRIGRRPLPLRQRRWTTVRHVPPRPVPPRCAVGARGRSFTRQHPPDVPHPQRVPGDEGLRRGRHGAVPEGPQGHTSANGVTGVSRAERWTAVGRARTGLTPAGRAF